MQGLVEISGIKGNSGQGSPVFSKPGLSHNKMYMAFNKESMPRKPVPEEQPFDYDKWRNDMAEIANKQAFAKKLGRFEAKKNREQNLERMIKQGMSKAKVTDDDDGVKAAKKKKLNNITLIGDVKKDKLKHSLGMSNEEKERLVKREKDMNRNKGICMSEIQVPGPGAYKPQFSQIDAKSDRVSHALQTLDKRTTYFDRLKAQQKDKNEVELMAELGCCERVMRNLSAVNQMTDLKALDSDSQAEAMQIPSVPTLSKQKADDVKSVIEKNLANFMAKQAAEKNLFTPNNTQYQRLVQKVSNNLNKTKYSPHSDRNLQDQIMQAFGTTGQGDRYRAGAGRDCTLGYFSVKEPWETGNQCNRFRARTLKAETVSANGAIGQKSELREGNGDSAPSEQDEQSVLVQESHGSEMQGRSWFQKSRHGSIAAVEGGRKSSSDNLLELSNASVLEKAKKLIQMYATPNIQKKKSEAMEISGQLKIEIQPSAVVRQPATRRNSEREELKFRKSQVSFNNNMSKLALNSSSELTSHQSDGPPELSQIKSVMPPTIAVLSSPRAGGDLSMIPTNKLVAEIVELDNDESPNIAKSKVERKTQVNHMGFQPAVESANIGSQNNLSGGGIVTTPKMFQSNGTTSANAFDKTQQISAQNGEESPHPVNILTKKNSMFGQTYLNTAANSHTLNNFGGSGSFFASTNHLSGFINGEMSMTNYESALEWGKLGLTLKDPLSYQKTNKAPTIHYKTSRPGPIVLNDVKPVTDRALLPLVSHRGAFASQMRWDDTGTYHINKARTPRFSAASYLGEKPFLKEQPSPRPMQSPDHQFNRTPQHIFPGLKKVLDPLFFEDKKALFKKIIQGKEKVSSFRELIQEKRKLNKSEPITKVSVCKQKPSSVDVKFQTKK